MLSGFSLLQLAAVRRCGQNISLPLYASQADMRVLAYKAEPFPQASSSQASITPCHAAASHDHEQPRAHIDSRDKEPDSHLSGHLQRFLPPPSHPPPPACLPPWSSGVRHCEAHVRSVFELFRADLFTGAVQVDLIR
jgi:hypothetical protein